MLDNVGEKDICLKCGKCCRLIQSLNSYNELCKKSKEGDKAAANFLKLFLPYDSLEDVIKIDPVAVDKIIDSNRQKFGSKTQTHFYHCRYLSDDNTCKVYNMRPKLCKEYPKSVFTILPENCAYEGYLFEKQEEIKKHVRKLKEALIDISHKKEKSLDLDEIEQYNNLEKKYDMLIEKFSQYGSKDW